MFEKKESEILQVDGNVSFSSDESLIETLQIKILVLPGSCKSTLTENNNWDILSNVLSWKQRRRAA